ncbi:MAG: DsbE family thiol:disulfide interchange protein [Pseudomonadota bacterium]|nr:DsbE family thiol:disulfide interchange protein [Pseudomonadota bacterium]
MTEATETAAGARKAPATRWLVGLLPVVVFATIGWFLYQGLSLDPKTIPSALINKPVPEFDLPPLPGHERGLSRADLTEPVQLVNVFASWCVACRVEHPLLMEMQRKGVVPIHGLNYKDGPSDAVAWLNQYGDPYDRIGVDLNGRVGIDFGVYGVPETFIVDGKGVIVEKIIGPITPMILQEKLLPLIAKMRADAGAARP